MTSERKNIFIERNDADELWARAVNAYENFHVWQRRGELSIVVGAMGATGVFVRVALLVAALHCCCVIAKKHRLRILDDDRKYIALSTFGFYEGGILEVKLTDMLLPNEDVSGIYGFTLDRTKNDAMRSYLDSYVGCPLIKSKAPKFLHQPDVVYFKMNLQELRMEVECGGNIQALHLYRKKSEIPGDRAKRHFNNIMMMHRRRRRNVLNNENVKVTDDSKDVNPKPICSNQTIPITKETKNNFNFYNVSFVIFMESSADEGYYNLYFHNCYTDTSPLLNFLIEIYESNEGNYLSAGDIPLPALYSMMSLLFLLCACFWCFILCTSRHPVYKIHILMCILVFLKALSLALHGVNYHFIQTRGEHVPAWAILFYITHLFKGALLFITIVLVGTGWNFIKHILADRDKKLFMIVIPLQVVANVAEIIIEESEEGSLEYNTWRYLFFLVDLLCCGAILFPIVWSIRHLQEASNTDGKALMNLRKLKLFRHFYIMVVCYIYSTRIIACLLKKTVPFQYSWLNEMFKEMATFTFFVMTGYKFRPASANPYFSSPSDYTSPQVLTDIAACDGLTKLNKMKGIKRNEGNPEDYQPLMQEMTNEYD